MIEGLTDISDSNGPASFEWNTRRDELVSFGDVTYHENALKISFENPGNFVSLEEAPDKLIRDVRPRYVGHEVILSGEPGLAPAHGQDPANVSQRETLRVTLVDANQKFQIVLC